MSDRPRCADCGHERRWHRLNGREKDGTYRVTCWAGVPVGMGEPMEFCECDSKRLAPSSTKSVLGADGGAS